MTTTPVSSDSSMLQPLGSQALASIRALETHGSPGLMTLLINIFLDDAPKVMQHLQHAVRTSDKEATKYYAHRLKGSCANFGAQSLMKACQELEDLSSTGSTRGAARLLRHVELEYMRVRRALEHLRHGDIHH